MKTGYFHVWIYFAPGDDFPAAGSEDECEKVITAITFDALLKILVTAYKCFGHQGRFGSYSG